VLVLMFGWGRVVDLGVEGTDIDLSVGSISWCSSQVVS
jgi:hypothetical protein